MTGPEGPVGDDGEAGPTGNAGPVGDNVSHQHICMITAKFIPFYNGKLEFTLLMSTCVG